MRLTDRRALIRVGALATASLAAGCALHGSGSSSTGTAVTGGTPSGSGAASAPGQMAALAAEPASQGAPQAKAPSADRDVSAEWEALAAAARAEGKLSLLSWVGRGYRPLIQAFETAFPGIAVENLQESSADVWLSRLRRERRAGTYAFDVGFLPADRALTDGARDGLWAPLKPLLFAPEVLDDRHWRGGLNARFVDAAGEVCFSWSHNVFHTYAINTDLVPEGAITSAKDLLDPRWRGKILSGDPRLGTGLLAAAGIARAWGPNLLKPLLVDQRPVFINSDPTGVTEPLARGRYPIALGVRPKALDPLRAQGIGLQVRYLDLPDADFVPAGAFLHFDRAPHPAAAKLFANWVLAREAQSVMASNLEANSARVDVPVTRPDETGIAGAAYYEPDRETNYGHTAETKKLVTELLRSGR